MEPADQDMDVDETQLNEESPPQDLVEGVQFPNRKEVVDGVEPWSETPQDAEFGLATDEELEREMEA